jgi:hypothetical protein
VSPRRDKETQPQPAPKRGVRARASQRLLRWGRFRRWYIKRTLRFIDRSKEKGRRLPEGMAETARQLSRVPKQRRAEALEEAIMAERDLPEMGREYRRAASRQRLSTRSDTRYRQGRPPGAGRQARPPR